MAMKVTLKPFERIEIGAVTLTNGWFEPSTFSIEGSAPVLRQANTMDAARADTPLKQVYLSLQKLYLERGDATPGEYRERVERLLAQMPDVAPVVRDADRDLAAGRLYDALRRYRGLLHSVDVGDGIREAVHGNRPAAAVGAAAVAPRPACEVHQVRDRRRYRSGRGAQSA